MPDAAGDGDDGPAALTVSELNAHIAGVVDDPTFRSVACVGEVSDWYQNDTTCYFTVIDGDAELDCPLWTSRHRRLDCEVEDGDEVFLRGAVDYWTDGGKLQLKPSDLRVLGEGDRLAAVEELRRDLRERGWLDEDRKRPVPRYPDRVGLVTSREGDARHDVTESVHDRHPGIEVVLVHASVQGEAAPDELAAGVAPIDGEVDVVVGRGGGSDTDLAAFDTETVATAL
jgi:exodeoxyribonuclease VII large subunit